MIDPPAAAGVERVVVHTFGDESPDEDPGAEPNDSKAIAALLEVFALAEETKDHECGESGTIERSVRGGRNRVLFTLLGHDDSYYELRDGRRNYKIYRVPRDSFLAALRALGAREVAE
jgi:hypothetical protein